jgi:hypothetical protein
MSAAIILDEIGMNDDAVAYCNDAAIGIPEDPSLLVAANTFPSLSAEKARLPRPL